MTGARLASLTALAMLAFAANSVLARLAFATAGSEPMSYTAIRLGSGAIVLYALLRVRQRGASWPPVGGSWAAAAALFGYAIAFSIAYIMLGAGTGALILFASVQMGILGWAMLRGDRPGVLEWTGIALAVASLAYLVSPGLVAPDPFGTLLMVGAGLCWAAYTLMGRGSQSPLTDTTGNFVRCLPIAIPLLIAGVFAAPLNPAAVGYAIASGAIASGLGYAIWYAALPGLTRVRAAIVQLTVPAIAAAGGVLLIAEPLTFRLGLASIGILGGVAIALIASERRRRQAST